MKTRIILGLIMVIGLVLGGVALAGDPGWSNQPTGAAANQPENWEAWAAENGETWECVKIDNPSYVVKDGLAYYTMPSPGTGYTWRLLKVKAGTVDTLYWDPVTGGQYPSDRDSISHIIQCKIKTAVEKLEVSKTAVTSFTRTYKWDIAKSVATEKGYMLNGYPKIWLYIDGSGNEKATWTVDVTHKGYDDSNFNVSGVITIKNTGTLDAVITSVVDKLAGTTIDVNCDVTFPYTLVKGATLTCTYSEDGYVEGKNKVTVTTERKTYKADALIVWGAPTTEINKTVNVKDVSNLFGTQMFGPVTAPNNAQFTYEKAFAWTDYGVGSTRSFAYDNTATIVETGQYAKATLKVNVQGYIYETAYAKGDGAVCFIPTFRNWGWTNLIEAGTNGMELWAGAAQCDTSKGTLVGTVSYNGGVAFNVSAPYYVRESHVYAGPTKFPLDRRGRETVAPGQYYIGDPQNWLIVHAVVGIPDPKFGP